MASTEASLPVTTDAQAAASSLSNTTNHAEASSPASNIPQKDSQSASMPVEMTNLSFSPISTEPVLSHPEPLAGPSQLQENTTPKPDTLIQSSNSIPLTSTPLPPPEPSTDMPSLNRQQTVPAIGPASDRPIPTPAVATGPQLIIILLLNTGARHPYRIDEKYLKKRNVEVPDNNPINMSVYTLKELIWREWREEWDPRPSSPSSIRLIHYGKMLDDKAHLKDGKFTPGETPHVVHMTIKPQEVVDDEDARIAKGSARDREGAERSPRCRCVMM